MISIHCHSLYSPNLSFVICKVSAILKLTTNADIRRDMRKHPLWSAIIRILGLCLDTRLRAGFDMSTTNKRPFFSLAVVYVSDSSTIFMKVADHDNSSSSAKTVPKYLQRKSIKILQQQGEFSAWKLVGPVCDILEKNLESGSDEEIINLDDVSMQESLASMSLIFQLKEEIVWF